MQPLVQYVDHLEITLINWWYARLELRSLIEQVLALLSRKNREAQGLQGGQTVDVSIFERHVFALGRPSHRHHIATSQLIDVCAHTV